jgi:hypothetical protein
MPAAAPTFRDPTRLTHWLRLLLYANAATFALSIISDGLQQGLLASAPFSPEDAELNDTRQRIVSILSILSFVATAIVFLVWTYRASANVRQLGARDMTFTPG